MLRLPHHTSSSVDAATEMFCSNGASLSTVMTRKIGRKAKASSVAPVNRTMSCQPSPIWGLIGAWARARFAMRHTLALHGMVADEMKGLPWFREPLVLARMQVPVVSQTLAGLCA